MPPSVLLIHHHRGAMAIAAERGFWMPLALERAWLPHLRFLTAVSRGQGSIALLLEISGFEAWRQRGCGELWLPFVGQRITLPSPVPLGNRRRLRGWLPQRRQERVVVPLLALLAAPRLSDLAP
ncbi:MAG: hypothetical protein ACKOFN_05550 [Vulcanococcus sp.]